MGDKKSDFSLKVAYLMTSPEFAYWAFILGRNAGHAQVSQVVKLVEKRAWIYPILGVISHKNEVWFKSEFWDIESDFER